MTTLHYLCVLGVLMGIVMTAAVIIVALSDK